MQQIVSTLACELRLGERTSSERRVAGHTCRQLGRPKNIGETGFACLLEARDSSKDAMVQIAAYRTPVLMLNLSISADAVSRGAGLLDTSFPMPAIPQCAPSSAVSVPASKLFAASKRTNRLQPPRRDLAASKNHEKTVSRGPFSSSLAVRAG